MKLEKVINLPLIWQNSLAGGQNYNLNQLPWVRFDDVIS